jgi:hypothetical protein
MHLDSIKRTSQSTYDVTICIGTRSATFPFSVDDSEHDFSVVAPSDDLYAALHHDPSLVRALSEAVAAFHRARRVLYSVAP